jgi:hypothetical protein
VDTDHCTVNTFIHKHPKVEGPTVKEGEGIVEGETETGRWIDYEEGRKGCRRDHIQEV